MKTTGLVMSIIGGFLIVGSIGAAATKYDLSSSHDVSKAAGGVGLAVVILVVGLVLYRKGKKQEASGGE